MPAWLSTFLQVILFSIVILIVYNALKVYVLSKINANKWVVLIAGVLVFFIPTIAAAYFNLPYNGTVWSYIHMGVFVILFLWFMDIIGFGASRNIKSNNKKDDVVIRPKAKPNRVKHIEKDSKK